MRHKSKKEVHTEKTQDMSARVYNVIDAQYVPGIISGNNVIMFMQRNNFSQLRLGDEIKGVLIITPSQARASLCLSLTPSIVSVG